MNAIEILGLACVDRKFRDVLFAKVEAVILANRVDLTWAEEEGLRRITSDYLKVRKPAAAAKSDTSAESAPAGFDEQPNNLKKELEDVGNAIANMWCPEAPCPWPTYFTQNPSDDAK
jgi:hypothetical protein